MENNNLMLRYMEAMQQINSTYNLIAQKYKISYNTLMSLYILFEYENVTQKMICEKLFYSKSTVHSIIIDLTKKGYIELIQGNNNKEKFINFTKNGLIFINEIMKDTTNFENEVIFFLGKNNFITYLDNTEKYSKAMVTKSKVFERKE